MLLVDALYINYGGALGLLRYLVQCLKEKGVLFFLLADARCGNVFSDIPNVECLSSSILNRREFYRKHGDEFSSVFCFANVPPPIRLRIPVYTYFHNINMLTLSNCRDKKQRVTFWLKRLYIKTKRHNTDEWFVQTSNTATELINHLDIEPSRVFLYPFFRHHLFPTFSGTRSDYIFVGEFSGSKGHTELLRAWQLLHEKGIDRTLHLTVSQGGEFLQNLQDAIKEGVPIVNHGYVPMEQLVNVYSKSKATVYPSFNESFGLGLVEAMEAGCDVIGADLPYTYAICKPSEVFNPNCIKSIVDAVIRYETGKSPQTTILVSDMIDEMLLRICI